MQHDVYFNSRAGGGKDTQARYLIDRRGYAKLSLAGPLKDFACYVLGISLQEIEGNKKAYRQFLIGVGNGARDPRGWWVRHSLIPRFVRLWLFRRWLETFGHPVKADVLDWVFDLWTNDWGRPDYWLDRFKRNYECHKHHYPHTPVAVTDVRYPNEGQFMIDLGLYGIRLHTDLRECEDRLGKRDGTTDFSFLTQSDSERLWDQVPVHAVTNGNLPPEEVAANVAFLLDNVPKCPLS